VIHLLDMRIKLLTACLSVQYLFEVTNIKVTLRSSGLLNISIWVNLILISMLNNVK